MNESLNKFLILVNGKNSFLFCLKKHDRSSRQQWMEKKENISLGKVDYALVFNSAITSTDMMCI